MRKSALALLAVVTLLVFDTTLSWSSSATPSMPPDQAINALKEGNARYVGNTAKHPNQNQERRSLTVSQGQHPFASVLSCSDSRVPVEILFDSGIGDLFVIRVAGNVADIDETGSIEYGVDHLGTSVLLVLGHSRCGAVTAVVQNAQVHGNIPPLVDNIGPAVAKARAAHPELSGDAVIDEAIKANVLQAMDDVFKLSEVVRNKAKDGSVKVIGAIYDLETGKINWLGSHPEQDQLIAKYSVAGTSKK